MNRASRFYHSPSLRRYFCRRELTRYSPKEYSPGTKRKEINYDTCVCIYILKFRELKKIRSFHARWKKRG